MRHSGLPASCSIAAMAERLDLPYQTIYAHMRRLFKVGRGAASRLSLMTRDEQIAALQYLAVSFLHPNSTHRLKSSLATRLAGEVARDAADEAYMAARRVFEREEIERAITQHGAEIKNRVDARMKQAGFDVE